MFKPSVLLTAQQLAGNRFVLHSPSKGRSLKGCHRGDLWPAASRFPTACQCLDGRQLFVPEMACTAARHVFVLEDKDLKPSAGKNLVYLSHRPDFDSKKIHQLDLCINYMIHSGSISLKYHCCNIYFLTNYPAFTAPSTGHNPSLPSELI